VRRRRAEGLLFAGRVDEALKVAGATPVPRAATPAAASPKPHTEPPELAPSAAASRKAGWLAAFLHRFRKA
jgi:hypothetical protein